MCRRLTDFTARKGRYRSGTGEEMGWDSVFQIRAVKGPLSRLQREAAQTSENNTGSNTSRVQAKKERVGRRADRSDLE